MMKAMDEAEVPCSDSSMDDCNKGRKSVEEAFIKVQIPLWTIVTLHICPVSDFFRGSDSSMDDCNLQNVLGYVSNLRVQIPLWTIVTNSASRIIKKSNKFRFLYGRL